MKLPALMPLTVTWQTHKVLLDGIGNMAKRWGEGVGQVNKTFKSQENKITMSGHS